jgi:hypothetical protein
VAVSPPISVFRPIFVGAILEQAVIDTIKKWAPTYLREIERILGRQMGDIPAPRSYTTRRRFEKFVEDQTPTIIVVSPGTADEPSMEGDGHYRAEWALGVGAVVSTSTQESTNLVAKIYGAAIRSLLIQHGSLGGVASGIRWMDESYDDLPSDDSDRTLGSAALYFRVEVDEVVNRYGGPDGTFFPAEPDPDLQPGSEWPPAETVEVTLLKEAL